MQIEDAKGMFELNNADDILKNTGDRPFKNIEEAEALIRNYKQFDQYKMGRFTLLLRSTQEYIGWCGLKYIEETKEIDLGYRLLPQFRGNGLATEAAEKCLEYGFETLSLEKIIGRAIHENKASINILQKIGMTFEKKFNAHDEICDQYKMTKHEWNNRMIELKNNL